MTLRRAQAAKPRPKPKTPARRDAGRPRGAPVEAAVLACALAELAAHGPEGLRIERIAQATALNKTSIYRRWPTREALVAAVLERVADDLSVAVPSTGSLRGDLFAVGRAVADLLTTPAGRGLARAALEETMAPELAALARRKLEEGAGAAVATLVEGAMARGEWRPDAPPEVVLPLLVGGVLHRCLLEQQPPSTPWLEAVVDILCLGVAPRSLDVAPRSLGVAPRRLGVAPRAPRGR